jgi:peptidylprolyl isomerase
VRRQQRQVRRKKIITGSAAIVIIAAIVLLIVGVGLGGNTTTTTTSSTTSTSVAPTTTAAQLPSAAGKPCVATKGPLPKGAPAVAVQVGAPPTKLVIKDVTAGTGAVVKAGQTLSVDYIGVACSTGVIFDSSYSRNQPASFALSGVIQGWQQGIPGMHVGGERLLGIPAALAYGASPPAGSGIAPDEPLWFVVHVRSAK